ncbi:MAG TPA: polysaccharide deacetylase family protein [Candidatus Brocadiia bacterium]|nr:polysaccharide deacetylase family protein [Candidatus Brocadiia bacterium]
MNVGKITDMRITPWRGGKRWVYSVTYDEGLQALLGATLETHRKFGVPGHVSLVAADVGRPRNVPGSSFDKMMILSRAEIDSLCAEGWGVSNHSMTHAAFTRGNARVEIVESRKVLEDALGRAITMFIVPGSNDNYPLSREFAAEAGYLSVVTLWDEVNLPDCDLLKTGRTPLIEEGFYPFFSVFDPYSRLCQARDLGGWVVDYTHIARPREAMASPPKEISLEHLAQRFEKVKAVGGEEVWLGEATEVQDYILCRRHCRMESSEEGWTLFCNGLPQGVQKRIVTVEATMEDGSKVLQDLPVRDGLELPL